MPDSAIATSSIAFLGFGEAAHAFLDGWRMNEGFKSRIPPTTSRPIRPDPEARTAKRADYVAANVIGASTAPDAAAGAEAVFSVVTADQAHVAALAALPGLAKAHCSSTAILARPKPRSARLRRWTRRADATSTSR